MTRGFDADDAWHFAAGTHTRLWEVMGAHPGDDGVTFRVWAPNASAVSVLSDHNGWTPGEHALDPDTSGVWRGTFDGYRVDDLYKFSVTSGDGVHRVDKSDPFARATQIAPETASVVASPEHPWGDGEWMASRAERNRHDAAISIHQRDAVLWAARLEADDTTDIPDDRHVHVFVARGSGALDPGGRLGTGDAARLTDTDGLAFTAGSEGAEVLIWATS